MNQPESYRREIDACRPGSDDLQLPELANLASAMASDPRVAKELEAAHAADILLCEGLHEVPVPSGLAERMLAGLSERRTLLADRANENAAKEVVDASATVSTGGSQADTRRFSRRALWIAIPALAATLLAALGIGFWDRSQPKTIGEAQLASLFESWYQQAAPLNGWERTVDARTLERFPIDPAIRRRPTGQRTMLIQGAAEGVAYELTPSGRQRAILLVIRTPDRYSVGSLAFTPIRATGGKAVGAWQRGEYLYVLAVVEGDGQRIHDFVRRPEVT